MNRTVVMKLFARSYIVDRKDSGEYHSFIVREIPKDLKENDTIELSENDAMSFDGKNISNIKLELKLIKLLSTKIRTFKKSRRKRYTRHVGYRQHYGYFKINKIIQ